MATIFSKKERNRTARSGMAGVTLRGQALPMIYLFLFAIYFLAPLLWMIFSSTKSESDFTNSFGF